MASFPRFQANLNTETGEIVSLIELYDATGALVVPPLLMTSTNGAIDSDGRDFATSLAFRKSCEAQEKELVTACRFDDVDGGLTNVVSYVEVWAKCLTDTGINSELIGTYTDDTCSVEYVPVNPLPEEPGSDLVGSETVSICMQDDVLGDGSEIRSYVSVYQKFITLDGLNSVKIGDYTDATCQATYAPQNPIAAECYPENPKLTPKCLDFTGPGVFQIPSNAVSFSFIVMSIGDTLSPPTLVDNTGNTVGLDSVGMSKASQAEGIAGYTTTPTFFAGTGDRLVISWNEA